MKLNLVLAGVCAFLLLGNVQVKAAIAPSVKLGEEVRLHDDSSSLFAPSSSQAVASEKIDQGLNGKVETFKKKAAKKKKSKGS